MPKDKIASQKHNNILSYYILIGDNWWLVWYENVWVAGEM